MELGPNFLFHQNVIRSVVDYSRRRRLSLMSERTITVCHVLEDRLILKG
jgi:hypothetical protein